MKLFIDIETIPVQNEDLKNIVASKVKAPGSYKKQETIDKYIAENRDGAILKTSFNGLYGEIICIGFAVDDHPIECVSRHESETEKNMLVRFWDRAIALTGKNTNPTWVGHNICEFDLRFLFHRSLINGVKPSLPLPYNAKPWARDVYDTLYEVMGNNHAGGSLDAISIVLGLGGKAQGMDGSQVWPEYQKGNINKIAEYCKQDVELTREIYKRLHFAETVKDTLNPLE